MGRARHPAKWLILALPFIASGLLFPTLSRNLSTYGSSLVEIAQTDSEFRRELLSPGAGLRFAPVSVQAMLFLMKKHAVTQYRVSDSIRGDRRLIQRLVEGSYPSIPNSEASFLLLLEGEALADGCRSIELARAKDDLGNDAGAILARCD